MTKMAFGFTREDTIIVTDADSGIDRATAVRAAQQGLKVGAWGLNPDGFYEAVELLQAEGAQPQLCLADASNTARVEEGVTAAKAELGPIRCLLNNAGPRPLRSLTSTTPCVCAWAACAWSPTHGRDQDPRMVRR